MFDFLSGFGSLFYCSSQNIAPLLYINWHQIWILFEAELEMDLIRVNIWPLNQFIFQFLIKSGYSGLSCWLKSKAFVKSNIYRPEYQSKVLTINCSKDSSTLFEIILTVYTHGNDRFDSFHLRLNHRQRDIVFKRSFAFWFLYLCHIHVSWLHNIHWLFSKVQ